MSRTLVFAWRHFLHYRKRGLLLVASIALVCLLPVAVKLVVADFASGLAARAAASPLVVGARGSRYDLVLSSLYFRGRIPEPVSLREVEAIQDGGLADAVPVHLGHRARGFPIVGTTHDYYAYRRLSFAAGAAPAFLGEVVLGASVASELGLGPGDRLLSDQGSLFELSLTYPLRMHVVGVLDETGGPDDGAVFCDLKTAWILDGIGHGHVAAEKEADERVLKRTDDAVVLSPATFEYNEVTAENILSFHFHGEPADFPVEAIFCLPKDERSATILKGRYRVAETTQILEPAEVVGELLGLVFRLQRFFDVNALFVGVAMAMLLGLVFLLSLRLRAAEFETLRRIGFARGTIARLVAAEWSLILFLGAALVVVLGASLAAFLARFGDVLLFGGMG